jgi:hypothetical protein
LGGEEAQVEINVLDSSKLKPNVDNMLKTPPSKSLEKNKETCPTDDTKIQTDVDAA